MFRPVFAKSSLALTIALASPWSYGSGESTEEQRSDTKNAIEEILIAKTELVKVLPA